jgi:2,4-dienoyl-CoA reductase-like NADH-dependent reductase (Old Yellow Enzyme family)
MSILFSPAALGRLVVPNRIVRSATHEGLADDAGNSTLRLVTLLEDLANGGVGTVISGHTYVLPEGRASRWQLGAAEDHHVSGLRKIAHTVQQAGAVFILQLAHAGARADTGLIGQPAKGPSPGACGVETAEEMSPAEIHHTIDGFIAAAARAQEAGCNGVQIHAAHGYFLSTFLSPLFNRRTDEWGGNTENRAKILLNIVSGIRRLVHDDFAILVKMNAADYLQGGLETEEMIQIAQFLKEAGVDAVEMSGGTPVSGQENPIRTQDDSVWYENSATMFKKALDLPLILVGGIRDPATAERLISSGVCDAVSLSRPLIREPGLAKRWQAGDWRSADCISCNRCFVPMRKGEGLRCMQIPKV